MTILASKRSLLASKWPILASTWPILGSTWQIWASKGAPGRIWRKTARLPLSRIKNLSKKCGLNFEKFGLQNRPNDNFGFKTVTFSFKMATFGFKMARSGLQTNLGFQRGPGQELAENGPFAFKPQKEFIEKNTAFILENLAFETVRMTIFGFKTVTKWPILASKWPILGSKWPIRGSGRGQEEARRTRKRPGKGQEKARKRPGRGQEEARRGNLAKTSPRPKGGPLPKNGPRRLKMI